MSSDQISMGLQRFIFENIDSIGFLEALLLLHADPTKPWTQPLLTQELRSSPWAVGQYLKKMEALKLVHKKSPDSEEYIYDDTQSGFGPVIIDLAENYQVQRHKIYELIYSPSKKARDFSNAFLFPGSDKKKGSNDDS